MKTSIRLHSVRYAQHWEHRLFPVSQRDTTAREHNLSGDIFPIPKRKSKGISDSPGWKVAGRARRTVEGQYPATDPTLVHDHHRVDRVSGRPDPAQNGAGRAAGWQRALHPQHNIMLRRGPPICCGRDCATPHERTGTNNYRRGRKNPQRHHNVLPVENMLWLASLIFIPSLGSTESSEWSVPLRRDRTAGRHSEGFWPQCDTIPHCGTDLENVPIIVHPLLRRWTSKLGTERESAPNRGKRPHGTQCDHPHRHSPPSRHHLWFLTNWNRWSRKTLIGARIDETGHRGSQSAPRNSKSGLNPI